MDASTKYQQNIIMQNLKDMKSKYTQLEQEHKDLQLLCTKQKERFADLELRRNQLIKLFKEKMFKIDHYKASIESLQKENNSLNTTIQEQTVVINEYSTAIETLKRENAALKNRRNEPANVVDKGIKKPVHQIHSNGLNKIHFSHPSFDSSTSDGQKKKKKSPLVLQNRYTNLDILVNRIRREKEITEENCTTASSKKRKLFSLEDDMIDLTINVDD